MSNLINPFLLPNPFFRIRYLPNMVQPLLLHDVFEAAKNTQDFRRKFEESFRNKIEAKSVLATNSGRSAILLALRLLNIGKNKEVVIPSLVCGAVADAVVSSNSTPVYADVKTSDGTIDPEKLSSSITDKTAAIVAVHYQGLPCDIQEICEIGIKRGIPVIEDCAHSIGSSYKGKHTGMFGDFAFFSFGPDKPMTTGSGGMLVATRSEFVPLLEGIKEHLPRSTSQEESKNFKLLVESSLIHSKAAFGPAAMVEYVLKVLFCRRIHIEIVDIQ